MFYILVFFAVSSTAPLIVAKSKVEVVDLERWRWLSQGNCPHIWMVNFYVKKEQNQAVTPSKALEREFADAATILSGIVKSGAYAVDLNFPSFVRIPSVMVYLPNNTHPSVFPMKNFKSQVKRPAYRLVKFVKDIITQSFKFPVKPVEQPKDEQRRKESKPIALEEIQPSLLEKAMADNENKRVFFLLLCDSVERELDRTTLIFSVSEILYTYYKMKRNDLIHGYTTFTGTKKMLTGITDHLVIPSIVMISSYDIPIKIYVYEGRLDVLSLLSWARDRLADIALVPREAIRVGVSRDDGFVGQVLTTEQQKFLLTIP